MVMLGGMRECVRERMCLNEGCVCMCVFDFERMIERLIECVIDRKILISFEDDLKPVCQKYSYAKIYHSIAKVAIKNFTNHF